MTPKYNLEIRGTGCYLPEKIVTNAYFEKILDTSDEWITTRSGIKERRYTQDGETSLTMALEASRRALDEAGMRAQELDMIIFGTVTPHYIVPATACLLQEELGAGHIPAFDIAAACSGFMYGMIIAANMIRGGAYKNILVIGSENLSKISDFQDRTSCILFGDGASAAIISATQDPNKGLIYSNMGVEGAGAKLIWMPGGGSNEPVSQKVVDERLHYLRMKGREVYKWAIVKMHEEIDQALAASGVDIDNIALLIPHQSNLRIIESACERLGLPREKVSINIDRYGNTSSASVGICLDEARKTGQVREGDLVLMMAMGGGLTWATVLIRL